MFLTEDAAIAWFESVIWPDGERHCGKCGWTRTREVLNGKPMPYWCTDRRSYFSVRTGTPITRSNVPLRKWAIAIYLCLTSSKSVSSMKLSRARRQRRDILPSVVHFEGRLVDRGVAPGRMDDPCTVEVAWRSDGGPTGERRLSLGELTGRGCWRPLGDPGEEDLRRARARVETREIAVARQILLEEARELSIRISLSS